MQRKTLFFLIALTFLTSYTSIAQQIAPVPYVDSAKFSYIRMWDATSPQIDPDTLRSKTLKDVKQTTQYFDGLGRPIQTVIKQGSLVTGSTANDLVNANLYDELGREIYKYLPFAANNTGSNTHITDGLFKLNPFQQDSTFNKGLFSDETWYYSQTSFEKSPLNRVLETFAPGNNWVGTVGQSSENNRHSIKAKYLNNTATDSVRIWNVTDVTNSFGSYATNSTYTAGTLYKNISIDENNNQVIVFNDKDGKIILKKVQLAAAVDTGTGKGHYGWLCTYYLYDDMGNLRCVIQPRGVELLAANSWDMSYSSGVILNEQCFRYEYDKRQRMVMKKVPGAGTVWMVYDARDRLVLTQDSMLRAAHQWLYTEYDILNRPLATGLFTDNSNYNNLSYHSSRADTSIAYPAPGAYTVDTLTKTFYGDYSWRTGQGNPLSASRTTSYDTYLQSPSNTWPYPQDAAVQTAQLKGIITGTKVKVLGTSSSYLYTVSFFDEKARPIQVQSQNISTGTDITITQYGWIGQPLLNIVKNEKAVTNAQTSIVLTQMTYDSLQRVVKVEKKASNTKVNSGNMPSSWKTIVQNEYDALSQLKKKKIGAAPLDSLTYEYNIRGWVLGMNRGYVKDTTSTTNYFGFDLGYDKTSFTVNGGNQSYATPQFNGNINGMLWRSTGDDMLRKYDFSYDAVNRLTGADFNQLNSNSFNKTARIDFSVTGLNYDANGNILNMDQKGWKVGGSVTIDSLLYTYISNSNRLLNVLDRRNDTATKLGDFRSSKAYIDYFTGLGQTKSTSAIDYSYDPNGNLTIDNNKDISTIHYNHLNLPDSIRVLNKGYIKYVYDASGNKLKKITVEGSKTMTTLYLFGNFVNDTLQYLPQEEGRIRFKISNNTLQYDYFIKDYLGNVRMLLTEEVDTATYPPVTLETGYVSNENIYYENVYVGRTTRPGGFYSQGANGDTVQLIRKNTQSIGVGKLLKIMAKDRIHVKVDYFAANETTDNSNANGLSSVLSALSSLIDNSSVTGTLHGSGNGSTLTTDLNNAAALPNFLSGQSGGGGTIPKAYLNILFFDEQFRFVSANSEVIPIDTKGSGQTIERKNATAKEAAKNGYVFVYVSNESNNLVYFDNFQVIHERGPLTEETHYYPFGLTMVGISSKALNFGNPENKKKFVNQELDIDLGVNYYQFRFRNHDPQIGRFIEIDPLAENYQYNSTYAYAENRVIDGIDLEGLEFWRKVGDFFVSVYEDGVKPAGDWINENINPLTPVVEFVTGRDYNKGNFDIPKQRSTSLKEAAIVLIPGGKVESTVVKLAEKKILTNGAEQVEKSVVKKIDKDALQRGVKNEEKTLAEEGLEKNTKPKTVTDPKTGKDVTTIPDSYTPNGGTVEVKDVKKLTETKQLRGQQQISSQSGQKATVITGTNTQVSPNVQRNMIVERKNYLGPQKN